MACRWSPPQSPSWASPTGSSSSADAPEVGLSWLFAATGERSGLLDWPPYVVHELRAGQTVLVEVAVFNAGDRAGTNARWNFVVDESIRLDWQGHEAAHRLVSFNDR